MSQKLIALIHFLKMIKMIKQFYPKNARFTPKFWCSIKISLMCFRCNVFVQEVIHKNAITNHLKFPIIKKGKKGKIPLNSLFLGITFRLLIFRTNSCPICDELFPFFF